MARQGALKLRCSMRQVSTSQFAICGGVYRKRVHAAQAIADMRPVASPLVRDYDDPNFGFVVSFQLH